MNKNEADDPKLKADRCKLPTPYSLPFVPLPIQFLPGPLIRRMRDPRQLSPVQPEQPTVGARVDDHVPRPGIEMGIHPPPAVGTLTVRFRSP